MNIKKHNGFSLVELVVALGIGVGLIGTITKVMLLNKNTSFTQNSIERMQDDSKFFLENINQDIRVAGFKGCVSGVKNNNNYINFKNATTTANYQTAMIPIQGYNGSAAFNPSLPSEFTSLVGSSPNNNYDVLTIRNSINSIYTLNSDMASVTDSMLITNTDGINNGDYAIVSNCAASSLIKIGTVNSNSIASTNASGIGYSYPAGSQVYIWNTINYYVLINNGINTLYRKINNKAAEKVVDNIEKFTILYGIDTNSDYNADQYVFANEVTNFNNVVSLKIGIVLKAKDRNTASGTNYSYKFFGNSYTPADNRLRKVYYTTISLRNLVP